MKRQSETNTLLERRLVAVADKQQELKQRIEKLQSRSRELTRLIKH
jgi:hypothetical protein